jgi:hypothetical protein
MTSCVHVRAPTCDVLPLRTAPYRPRMCRLGTKYLPPRQYWAYMAKHSKEPDPPLPQNDVLGSSSDEDAPRPRPPTRSSNKRGAQVWRCVRRRATGAETPEQCWLLGLAGWRVSMQRGCARGSSF